MKIRLFITCIFIFKWRESGNLYISNVNFYYHSIHSHSPGAFLGSENLIFEIILGFVHTRYLVPWDRHVEVLHLVFVFHGTFHDFRCPYCLPGRAEVQSIIISLVFLTPLAMFNGMYGGL